MNGIHEVESAYGQFYSLLFYSQLEVDCTPNPMEHLPRSAWSSCDLVDEDPFWGFLKAGLVEETPNRRDYQNHL